jgi:hypothetical protein
MSGGQVDGQYHAALRRVILFEEDDDWLADSLSDDGSFCVCQCLSVGRFGRANLSFIDCQWLFFEFWLNPDWCLCFHLVFEWPEIELPPNVQPPAPNGEDADDESGSGGSDRKAIERQWRELALHELAQAERGRDA